MSQAELNPNDSRHWSVGLHPSKALRVPGGMGIQGKHPRDAGRVGWGYGLGLCKCFPPTLCPHTVTIPSKALEEGIVGPVLSSYMWENADVSLDVQKGWVDSQPWWLRHMGQPRERVWNRQAWVQVPVSHTSWLTSQGHLLGFSGPCFFLSKIKTASVFWEQVRSCI